MTIKIEPCAILRGAILRGADLRGAILRGADLRGADLRGANLWGANLQGANLRYAYLRGAYLRDAILRDANLRDADLQGANLRGADLEGADLTGTILDPINMANGNIDEFETIDNGFWAVGYRARNSAYMNKSHTYDVGEEYEAPYFSTCNTDCHPGLYVCPAIFDASTQGNGIIKVIFRPHDCHKAGDNYRVRSFIVWEEVSDDD
jgi:hypothetical protein